MRNAIIVLIISLLFPNYGMLPTAQQKNIGTVEGSILLLNSHARLPDGRPDYSGVVIALEPLDFPPPWVKKNVQMMQKEKRFTPHVVALQVGNFVDFPNQDPFFHNVY